MALGLAAGGIAASSLSQAFSLEFDPERAALNASRDTRQEISAIFVYGTLQPNQRFWPMISEHIARTEPARLANYRLYALPEGYPGVTPGRGVVVGTLLHLKPDRVAQTLRITDQIERYHPDDARSLYRRVSLNFKSCEAFVYIYADATRLQSKGVFIESGDWLSG